MVYVFIAEGFEELEALAPVDVLRRGGVEVKTVGIGSKTVIGAHGIYVVCDMCEDEAKCDTKLEGIVLPGGMPGTVNLENSKTVNKFIDYAAQNRLLISAICAAPSILGHRGLLKDKSATCNKGFEKELLGANVKDSSVVRDGNIITSYGAGAAFEFAFALLEYLKDTNLTEKLKTDMRFK